MIESAITALIYIVLLCVVVYLVFWVFESIANRPIPAKIQQLIWIAVALVAILILVRLLAPRLSLVMAPALSLMT